MHSPVHEDIVKKLLDETWPVCLLDIRNNDGMTALHFAAIGSQPDIVRQLIVAGANPLTRDNSGSQNINGATALHLAAQFGHTNVVKIFIEHKLI
ncbi:hypothetical protein evm_014808 [Chilo suppressalis]|nr:hypothetical protein evm_014808 [Chilo suppressalis]